MDKLKLTFFQHNLKAFIYHARTIFFCDSAKLLSEDWMLFSARSGCLRASVCTKSDTAFRDRPSRYRPSDKTRYFDIPLIAASGKSKQRHLETASLRYLIFFIMKFIIFVFLFLIWQITFVI